MELIVLASNAKNDILNLTQLLRETRQELVFRGINLEVELCKK